jgi:hypothetical protein
MKKNILIALSAVSVLAVATPAAAQNVTGTVDITGTVAPKCLVVPGAGATFGTAVGMPVALGELAAADGTLASDLATRFSSIGAASLSARVVCTSAAPTIAVDADTITSATAPDPGYSNVVDFTASVAVTTTAGAAGPFSNSSSGAAGTATAIGGRLANNGGNNITISASAFTAGAGNPLLVAGSYAGKITVLIAPSI